MKPIIIACILLLATSLFATGQIKMNRSLNNSKKEKMDTEILKKYNCKKSD